jgi:hypothetical protein
MGFDIAIHSPAVILIVAGVIFLAFNDENSTGWVLVILGFLLAAFITYIRATRQAQK